MRIEDEDGLWRLAAAIVKQAKNDLRYKNRRYEGALEANRSRLFFRGPIFKAMCAAAKVNREDALRELGVGV